MGRPKTNTPKYRHYKPRNLAVVRIDGRDIYLGKYGSPESWAKYHRTLAEWHARKGIPSPASTQKPENVDLTVNEVVLYFLKWAKDYYLLPDSRESGEVSQLKYAARPLARLYGDTPAVEFKPSKLETVIEAMIQGGLSRRVINQRIGKILAIFRWATAKELIPPTIHMGLAAVPKLKSGRSKAEERPPVRPVSDADIDAIQPFVTRRVWAMIQVQRLTGMRPGEVVQLRGGDIDASGEVWVFCPRRHKTQHLGRQRRVLLGPRAQEILRPWLRDDPNEPLFSPAESLAEYWDAKIKSGKAGPRKKFEDMKNGTRETYSGTSYRTAIYAGCDRAGIPRWSPNRIRHSAATAIRREFGLDVAATMLGHSQVTTTQVYAERDEEAARRAAEKLG